MKLVNLIIGKKRNLMDNLRSISNCQNDDFSNINFFIFWKDDFLTETEKKILKKKYTNTYFKTLDKNKYEAKIKKILRNNKGYPKNMSGAIISNYLQYSLVQYAFNYACKKLKNEKFKSFFWQRIRSDILINDKIINNPQKKILYLPGTVHGYGVVDFHALGTFKEFKAYSNTIDTLSSLYKINIFGPPEIALRMQLTKCQLNCALSDKMPINLLLYTSKKSKLKHSYRLRSNKYLKNEFSNNIYEESFIFKDNFFLRKVFYFSYEYLIKLKLILNI